MKQQRDTALWDTTVPALTPDLPGTATAHEELSRQNKNLRRLLSSERRRNHKVVAVLVGHLDGLQEQVAALRESVLENLAAGLTPKGEQQ